MNIMIGDSQLLCRHRKQSDSAELMHLILDLLYIAVRRREGVFIEP